MIAGMTFQQVQKYEHGINRLSAVRLLEFAHVTGVEPGYFFDNFPYQPDSYPHAVDTTHADEPLRLKVTYAKEKKTDELADLFSRIRNPALRSNLIEIVRGLAFTS